MRRLLLALLVAAPTAAFADLSGAPLVMDGDTLAFDGQNVHLAGVHAPNITQYCGEGDASWACGWDAANRLEAIIGGREVTCTDVVEDADGHLVARCSAEGEDLAGLMVDEGLAVADAETGADYQARAQAAEAAEVGMWSGPFIDPVHWAEVADCGCTARKQSMMETAAALKAQREAEEAAAGGEVIEEDETATQ